MKVKSRKKRKTFNTEDTEYAEGTENTERAEKKEARAQCLGSSNGRESGLFLFVNMIIFS